jgi:hypothetical protein
MLRINLQQQIKIHQINLVPFKQIKKLWLLPITLNWEFWHIN